jgi:hypothetical protein
MCTYSIFKGNYVPAFLSIFWPFIGSLLSFPCAVGYGIGIYELPFMERLGYKSEG